LQSVAIISHLLIFASLNCKSNFFSLKKEATIYDIARELNLSASTVSRALKGNPVINQQTRKKINECAEKMGYRSNTFASNLRSKRTNTIGVIVPRLDSNFMSSCLAGMEDVASKYGYNMIISQSHESVVKEEQNAITMYNKRVDGLIVSLTFGDSDLSYFGRFAEKNVPVVFFDRVPDETNNVCFVIDNYKVARDATIHLIEQGCKKLLHITVDSNSNVYTDRTRGFFDTVKKYSKCAGDVLYLDSLSLETGKNIVDVILGMETPPDGLFVANDMTAVGCMLKLQEKGVKIPEQIAIVGFNDDLVSIIASPQLSTISYPGREAGRLAAKNLIDHLRGDSSMALTNKIVLNAHLIPRASSIRLNIN
jgi:LacI family transcriptional regulator